MVQNQGKHTINLVWSNATFAAMKSKSSKGRKNAGKTNPVRQMLHPIQLIELHIVVMRRIFLQSQ